MLDIYLPTYKRPHKLASVAKNIEKTTSTPFTLYFGLEKDDKEGIKAAKATGHKVIINPYESGYSNTVQAMYEQSNGKYWFHSNDDFVHLPGWDERPIALLAESDTLMVVGCHDGNPKTRYYTISMNKREYIEKMSGVVDIPNRVFYNYNHNYIDTEFAETAISRGVWDACTAPCIEHHNPGLDHIFDDTVYDETYAKNDKTAGIDAATYESRKHLWSN
jgi:GT2 family glycosyltransferase